MYLHEIEKVLSALKQKPIMVLATSYMNKVTARNMSVIVIQDRVYCQTDSLMEKAKQITKNQNVAFCIDNYQIYGKANIKGTWAENEKILEVYKSVHGKSYDTYKDLNTEIVIETQINEIEIWEYRNAKPYLIRIDLNKNEYSCNEYKIK